MIHKIAIENFFSIADRQELDFAVSQSTPDLPCFKSSRSNGAVRLPTVIGFFGPNASGKSTVLRALVSSVVFSLYSFDWPENQFARMFQSYRQKHWWGKPSKIVIEFDGQLNEEAPSILFRYELHVAHKPDEFGNKVVAYEALFCAPKGRLRCLFERNNQEFRFEREFDISDAMNDPRVKSIRPNASVLSTLTKLNHSLAIHLCKQIGALRTNIIGVDRVQQNIDQMWMFYAKNQSCFDRLKLELRRFDIGFDSMSIEPSDQGKLLAKFQHVGLDNFIYFEEESSGTKQFIKIFQLLHSVLEVGGVAIIDELDADFHPLLLPELFRWFSDPERNPKNAQLIFTAHNAALLDDLEKEQVFFTEKPSGESSQVYGARDIKGLRREPSLMKKYLSGELGAVPHIG